ncbi:MAG: hypothetical protein NVSMB32_01580 [Actinomycetota bacterium]
MSESTANLESERAHSAHAHPGPVEYIKVALRLALITAAEVAVYYISGLRSILMPILLAMSLVKFAVVGLYFMHLKFDTHLFRRLLIMGIILALMVYAVVLITLFHYL